MRVSVCVNSHSVITLHYYYFLHFSVDCEWQLHVDLLIQFWLTEDKEVTAQFLSLNILD